MKKILFSMKLFPTLLTFALLTHVACNDSTSANDFTGAGPHASGSSGADAPAGEYSSSYSAADVYESSSSFSSASELPDNQANSSSAESNVENTDHAQTSSPENQSSVSQSPASLSSESLSSSSQPTVSSSSVGEQTSAPISLDKDGFATVADVYKSLLPSEKAVFVIRHSERENSVSIETELTENGIKMAKDLGATLKSDEEFSYITSGFVRTNETANHIAAGRGTPNPKLITNYDITGNWFLKISAEELATYADNLGMQGSSIELMSHWAYGEEYPDALYELESRAKEFMETVIVKNLPKWNRVSIMVSHDIFVMPLAVFGSQGKVALKYFEDYHWINYIAGLAIIVGENSELRYVPVKGADSGIIDYLAIYKAEHNLNY